MGRIAWVIVLLLAGISPVSAQERSSFLPDIPKATGKPHAEGNEYWRRNHMDLMRHDRDSTLRQGDRDIGASLKGCFDCHAATDSAGAIVTYESEKHFCRACHDYVAVKVDCFMCHRSTPDGVDETTSHAAVIAPVPQGDGDGSSIVAYLRGIAGQDAEAEQ